MSGGSDRPEEVPATSAGAPAAGDAKSCDIHINKFYECLDANEGSIAECQLFFDMMNQCNKDLQMRSQYN